MLVTAEKKKIANAQTGAARPVLLLTINNGAGHSRAAEAIAEAWSKNNPSIPARVVEVSGLMSPLARFTHVTAYLWLVKNFPALWDKIDRYQKRQTQTSPAWFYRRECRKLFKLAREIQPCAIVATEVGCCEIAALVKRDLQLKIPLVAVNVNYDADRAWIQPEIDFYCLAADSIVRDFVELGARSEQIAAWGVPMQAEFTTDFDRKKERWEVNKWLDLPSGLPLILVAGGGEGIGRIEEIVEELLHANRSAAIVVLAGKNEKLKRNCERLRKSSKHLRILGWTNQVPQLLHAADVLISKLGNTFDEACACGLPIIALPPPPGSERAQYELLEKLGIGCAVKTPAEAAQVAAELLKNRIDLERMRKNADEFARREAAANLALWIKEKLRRDE
ncbi:MAG TPA: glycosyltransferase [Pyrinomonadaceae bacterium]|jgi:processive 1,2-diacylglycerol beta-glucosyltransferase